MRFISPFRDAAFRFSRDGCAFLAQSIAFNALFALFPLMVLVVSGATLFLPYAERRTLLFFDTFAPTLHDYVATNLQTYMYSRGITSAIALLVLIWLGKNLFMGLAYALDRALNVPKARPLVHNLLLSFVMLPVIGLLLVVAIALPVLLSITVRATGFAEGAQLFHFLVYVLSIALVFAVTLLLYRLLPNRTVSWGFSVRGACVVSIAWPIVQYGFAQYVGHVDFTRVYGALSAPLVLLFWFYCIGSIFLYGAEYAAVLSTHQ
jgi:membrane protein